MGHVTNDYKASRYSVNQFFFAPRSIPPMELKVENTLVPSLTRVLDEKERNLYWSKVTTLWGVDLEYFPGSHPVSIDSTNVRHLHDDKYVVALKTDGVRFLLLLTMTPSRMPIAIMIDRSLTFYEVSVWGNKHFFELGTLLDGELARDLSSKDNAFLVFDIVASAGERMVHLPFSERLQRIHNVLFRPWKEMDDEELETHVIEENKIYMYHSDPVPLVMVPKMFSPYANTRAVWNGRGTSNFSSDGLLFTRRDAPMAIGRTVRMLKFKERHTVDIVAQWSGTQWMPRLRASKTDPSLVPIETVCQGVKSVHIVQNDVLEFARGAGDTLVVECDIESDDGNGSISLFPMRIRSDKTVSNAASTVERTLEAQRNTWSLEDILSSRSILKRTNEKKRKTTPNVEMVRRTRSKTTNSVNTDALRKP